MLEEAILRYEKRAAKARRHAEAAYAEAESKAQEAVAAEEKVSANLICIGMLNPLAYLIVPGCIA